MSRTCLVTTLLALLVAPAAASASDLSLRDRVVLSQSRPQTFLGLTVAGKVDGCGRDYCRLTDFQVLVRCVTDGDTGYCVAWRAQLAHGIARLRGDRVVVAREPWRTCSWAALDSGVRAASFDYQRLRERMLERVPAPMGGARKAP